MCNGKFDNITSLFLKKLKKVNSNFTKIVSFIIKFKLFYSNTIRFFFIKSQTKSFCKKAIFVVKFKM